MQGISRLADVKVKKSHYRPGQVQRVPGDWGSKISRQSAREGGKVLSPTHRPPLPPGNIPGTHFCWGWVNLRDTVRPEGLCQWKISMSPSGIELATFRLVAQCLNQLSYLMPHSYVRTSVIWRVMFSVQQNPGLVIQPGVEPDNTIVFGSRQRK